MGISKINGKPISGYGRINGLGLAGIAKINGISLGGGGGAISFDDITHSCYPNSTWTNTIPIDFPLPSTMVSGDLVFIYIETDAPFSGNYLVTPTGWSLVFAFNGATSDCSGNLYWKIVDATDVANGYVRVYTTTTFNRDGQAWSWIATNVDTTNPISDVGVWTESVGTSKTIAGITPSADGLAVGFWGFDGGDGEPTTITAGWTKIGEEECDGTSSGTFGGFASLPSTSGVPTGNLIVTAIVSDGWGGIIVNFKNA